MGRKIQFTMLLLALCLLTGCAGWSSGSYQTIKPHREGYDQTGTVDLIRVTDYEGLLSVFRNLVTDHLSEAVLDVSQYTEDLENDIPQAVRELKTEPIPAYAVSKLWADVAEVGARRVANVTVEYRRTKEQVDEIHTIWGITALQKEICNAVENGEPTVTILMHGYTSVNMNEVAQNYYLEHLDSVMECPVIGAEIYPGTGNVRVLELKFRYDHTQEELFAMRRETQGMLSSAAGYVRGQIDERTKAERLYALLRPLISEEGTTKTPVYSLLCLGTGDSYSVATVFRLLCSQAGLECLVVDGEYRGEERHWNLVKIDDTYYHLDILADLDSWNLRLRYDDEMGRYTWDREAYPVSARPQPVTQTTPTEPEPRVTEPEEPTEPETTEPVTEEVTEILP